MPCQGVFADVQRMRSIEDIKEMKNILPEYEEYKNSRNNLEDYHQVIAGKCS